MDNSPVSAAEAATIEAAEARAWEDLYAAAPREWAEEAGVGTIRVGKTLVIRWAATGRRYFSRSIGLGVLESAQPEQLDEILGVWERAGIDMFLVKSMPQCLPEGYDELLRSRGLEPFDRQDRIVRDARRALDVPKAYEVERVEARTGDEWAEFLQRVYRLETGPWLQRLIGRPGWHQYVAREGAEIVAARGMFVGPDVARHGRPCSGARHRRLRARRLDLRPHRRGRPRSRREDVHRRHRGGVRGYGHAGVPELRPARLSAPLRPDALHLLAGSTRY